MKQIVLLIMVMSVFFTGCSMNRDEKTLSKFIDRHVAKLDPLSARANMALWNAETTGKQEYFDELKQLRLEINELYMDREKYFLLKELKDSGSIKDHRLKRQLDKLCLAFLNSRLDEELEKEIIALSTSITERYNKFRGRIDGKEVTMTEIYKIMTTSKDLELREKAWLASKQVGNYIVDDYLKLVKMRNESVGRIGFNNYHTYMLTVGEQDVQDIDEIFSELEELTTGPYKKLKDELDVLLAKDYGISVDQLRPWHYHDPFFQRTPLVYELDLNSYYRKANIEKLSDVYYAGVGLPVDDILARSDLYDKPGKNPHAFAEDIDRHGDVRVLCNIDNNERWMETALHELGHAVYFKYHDPAEPYLLREPAHAFTTEAAAMFFGRLSRNADWMQQMMDLTDQQRDEIARVSFKYLQFQQILFARWAMVMYNFEKQVYADPDQDLNTLWWDMVEKYQMVKRPEGKPDAGWASKLHFTVAPCYYHNYMLGELLASQWHYYIIDNVLKLDSDRHVSYVNDKRIGKYFIDEVFAPGAVYHWNEMIKRSTGENLTSKYFVQQFVN